MKTSVIMESIDRDLLGQIVPQRTKDEYFSLTAIVNVINKERMFNQELTPVQFSRFLQVESVAEFVKELEKEVGGPVYYKATKSSRGWIHPFLALKFLTHYNPKLEIKVYQWLWDYLIANRVKSGDSYLEMKGALYEYYPNKLKYPGFLMSVAKKIREALNVDDWNKATKEQLEARDYTHKMICDLTKTLHDSKQGVKLGIDALKIRYPSLCKEAVYS